MDNVYEQIGGRLKRSRKRSKHSQEEAAGVAREVAPSRKYDRSKVSRWESGEDAIPLHVFLALAKFYNENDLCWLLHGDKSRTQIIRLHDVTEAQFETANEVVGTLRRQWETDEEALRAAEESAKYEAEQRGA